MKRILFLAVLLIGSLQNTKAQTSTCGTIPFVVTVTQTQQILCNGQCTASLTANVSGGVGPFALQWNPTGATTSTISNLCAGTYVLMVIDGGQGQTCMVTVVVSQPAVLNTITTQMAPSCATACDGVIVGTQSGGTPGYTAAWTNLTTGLPMGSNPTQTGICNGQYQYCVTDANGCTDCDIITVNQTAPCAGCTLNVTTNVQPAICTSSTGVACVGVSGGSGSYSFLWGASAGSQTASCATGLSAGNHCVTITDLISGCDTVICMTVGTFTSPMVATAIPQAASCFGVCDGSATGLASGGTGPYQYSIDGGMTWISSGNFSGLCAGTYILQAMDANGCMAIYTFIISQPTAVSIVYSANPPSCATACDGSITFNVTGGSPPYMYVMNGSSGTNPVFNNLCNGTYVFCATDGNGCTNCVTVIFNTTTPCNPCGLTIISTVQPAMCTSSTGTACISVTGGSGSYSYLWGASAGSQTTACATNLPAGTHCVTITDVVNMCDSVVCVTVNQTTATVVATAIPTNATCNGVCDGQITALANGGTQPYTYALNNGPYQSNNVFTGVCAGIHIVYAKDAYGCMAIYTVMVTAPPAVNTVATVSVPPSNATSCNGTVTGTASGGTGSFMYTWYDGTGTPVATQPTYTAACTGQYVLCATDANGCTNCDTVFVSAGNSVAEWDVTTFSVYPNPANTEFFIQTSQVIQARVEVLDALGRVKYAAVMNGNSLRVDMNSDWSSGLYIVKISDNTHNGSIRVVKK